MSKFRGTRSREETFEGEVCLILIFFSILRLLESTTSQSRYILFIHFMPSSRALFFEPGSSCKYSLRHKVQAWKISFRCFNLVSKSLFSLHFVSRFENLNLNRCIESLACCQFCKYYRSCKNFDRFFFNYWICISMRENLRMISNGTSLKFWEFIIATALSFSLSLFPVRL